MSDYITVPVCESEPPSPFVTAEVCPTEVSTEDDDAECRCKPEKFFVSEGVQVADPVEQVITQPIEERVRTPDEAVPVVPLPVAGEDVTVPIPVPIPVPGPVPAQFPTPVQFQFQFQFTPSALTFPHVCLFPPSFLPSPHVSLLPPPSLPLSLLSSLPLLQFPHVNLLPTLSPSESCQLLTWTAFSSILWALPLPVLFLR